jgi:ADP-heptose:LPS heptosyltransferase
MFETIGDTLLASTIIASLRASDPRIEVVVFASRGNLGVLPLVGGIDRVIEVPLLQPLAAIRAVRSVAMDVMIDIGQWPRWYALLCVFSRSRHTIGFKTEGQSRHYAFDTAVTHRRDVHEVENFQALLVPFGAVVRVPPARALKPAASWPSQVDLQLDLPHVVFHPWAGGFNAPAREWPLDRWCELARRICASGHAVVISGGPADRQQAQELVARCGSGMPVRSIAGGYDIPGMAVVLNRASAAVCVNTGVMHLAALLDVPLIALHGPTSRLRWGPVSARAVALAPPADGRCEFLNLGFEYPAGEIDCMRKIGLDEVWTALQRMLETNDGFRGAAARR